MKKLFPSLCLILMGFVATTSAQFNTSETARKAAEKLVHGDRNGAIAILDKAIENRKDLLEAYQMRASLRSSNGDLDGAIADDTAALEINPNNAKIYESRAMFRRFKRDHEGALKDLDAAIANGLKTERVYTERALIKQDLGDTPGAIADYQTALTLKPNLASAHSGLAFTLEQSGNIEGAIAHLQEFLDRYEGKRDGQLPNLNDKASKGKSSSVKREGTEKDGSQVYSQNVEFTTNLSPEQMEQILNLAHCYAMLGRMYATKNDFNKALENYEKGLKINKDDEELRKRRSEIRIKQGDLQGAIEDLTAVVNSRGDEPGSHSDKGLLLLLQGKDAEAEKEFGLHLQMFPQAKEFLNKKIEEVKNLRSQQAAQ